jgi:hypothetical protein
MTRTGADHEISVRQYTKRVALSYATSIALALVATAIIMFAPESRNLAANISAITLVVLAAGVVGFTVVEASLPGIVNVKAGTGGPEGVNPPQPPPPSN